MLLRQSTTGRIRCGNESRAELCKLRRCELRRLHGLLRAGQALRSFGRHSSSGRTPLEVGGWVSVGGHGKRIPGNLNGPLGFNNLGDGVNVHQLWFYAGKEANTNGCGLDWGARVDYVFGVDGPDTQAFRGTQWDVTWDSGDYGSAIPQAYGEIAIDYLTVKAGYFYTPIGYEVVQAPQNFFYSHSYTQYYIEPFTHTGALATYDGFENFTFYGGWTAGLGYGLRADWRLVHVPRRSHLQPERRCFGHLHDQFRTPRHGWPTTAIRTCTASSWTCISPTASSG